MGMGMGTTSTNMARIATTPRTSMAARATITTMTMSRASSSPRSARSSPPPSPQHGGPGHHHHDDDVKSFVFRSERPFDPARLEDFLGAMVNVYGPRMLRY